MITINGIYNYNTTNINHAVRPCNKTVSSDKKPFPYVNENDAIEF